MIRVLSLGAGVQSSTVLLMSLRGELDRLDAAVFADTGWEPPAVYQHLEWLEAEAARAGVPVHRVSAGNIRVDTTSPTASPRGRRGDGERNTSIPFFVLSGGGHVGMLRRQCTNEYKIAPIETFIRRNLLRIPRGSRAPSGAVEQWFGISGDEVRRARISKERWKTHRYPLIFEKWMTRSDCLRWLSLNGYPDPPRSACIGCPYHSDAEWREIQADPNLWADVVEFDNTIRRKGGVRGDLFLHRSCKPLEGVDFSTPEERGQRSLWESECEGYCGN